MLRLSTMMSCRCRKGLVATQKGGVVLELAASLLAFLKHSLGVRKD